LIDAWLWAGCEMHLSSAAVLFRQARVVFEIATFNGAWCFEGHGKTDLTLSVTCLLYNVVVGGRSLMMLHV
jgi:hypothetical protein